MKDSDKIEERLRSSAEYLIDLMGNNVDEHMQEAVEAMLAAADEIRSYHNVVVGPVESLMGILKREIKVDQDQYAPEIVSISHDWSDATAYASLSSEYGVDEANGTIYSPRARDGEGEEIGGRTT